MALEQEKLSNKLVIEQFEGLSQGEVTEKRLPSHGFI